MSTTPGPPSGTRSLLILAVLASAVLVATGVLTVRWLHRGPAADGVAGTEPAAANPLNLVQADDHAQVGDDAHHAAPDESAHNGTSPRGNTTLPDAVSGSGSDSTGTAGTVNHDSYDPYAAPPQNAGQAASRDPADDSRPTDPPDAEPADQSDDDPATDPDDPPSAERLWSELRPFLEDRNYYIAEKYIAERLADPDYEPFRDQLHSEKADVGRLNRLMAAVESGLRQLEPGQKVRVGSIGNLEFVRYDESDKVVICRIAATGRQRETKLLDLRADEWLTIAQPQLALLEDADLTMALFLAVDKTGSTEAAKDLFNEVAGRGIDVDRYLERIEERDREEREAAEAANQPGASRVVKSKAQRLREQFAPDAVKIGDNYYLVVLRSVSWSEAVAICARIGGHLACFDSLEEQQKVADLKGRRAVWVGGCRHPTGRFVWLTNEFIPGEQVHDSGQDHDYVALTIGSDLNTRRHNGVLRPAAVGRIQGFICKWTE